ncbi:MAG: ThiF family adenylyltransferase [Rhodospirillaceae bacterium]|nr:ThiF family adenylyltransferase [Rhodospirillaceae bacterium]
MTSNTCDILVTADLHEQLLAHLFPGDDDEHGAILRAGIVQSGSTLRLLVQNVEPAKFGTDYVAGEYGYRALTPPFIHREILRCRDLRLAYLAVHNHQGDRRVDFSKIDLQSHERGYPALLDIGGGVPVGALVYGRRSVAADIWMPDGSRRSLGTYRIVGRTIKRLYSRPRRPHHSAEIEHDRQIRMFGTSGQDVLRSSKVAVVGLGGVGSLVAEYLARLGVGTILMIDPDPIDSTNLSRVVGATPVDVEVGLLKTQIAVRHARELARDTVLQTASRDVAAESVARTLRDCDFVFLAADSMRARLVVNAIAHQYLVPTVQIGAKVRPDHAGELDDAMCAVRHIRPASGCLWCNGFIDATQLAIESKSDAERKAQAYGVQQPNPSVITMNAVAAAHAVNDFLFDFLDLTGDQPPHPYRHIHFLTGSVQGVIPRSNPTCPECVHRLAMGDALELPVLAS